MNNVLESIWSVNIFTWVQAGFCFLHSSLWWFMSGPVLLELDSCNDLSVLPDVGHIDVLLQQRTAVQDQVCEILANAKPP